MEKQETETRRPVTPARYKQRRLDANLSLREMADMLGVFRSTICRRESGESTITIEADIAQEVVLAERGALKAE